MVVKWLSGFTVPTESRDDGPGCSLAYRLSGLFVDRSTGVFPRVQSLMYCYPTSRTIQRGVPRTDRRCSRVDSVGTCGLAASDLAESVSTNISMLFVGDNRRFGPRQANANLVIKSRLTEVDNRRNLDKDRIFFRCLICVDWCKISSKYVHRVSVQTNVSVYGPTN